MKAHVISLLLLFAWVGLCKYMGWQGVGYAVAGLVGSVGVWWGLDKQNER